jgi:hypothetical protein
MQKQAVGLAPDFGLGLFFALLSGHPAVTTGEQLNFHFP